MSVASAVELLSALPHVRDRVARRALFHAYAVPRQPITHKELRVAHRLELVPAAADADTLEALIAEASYAGQGPHVHAALSTVAEHCTKGPHPSCSICPLQRMCPYPWARV